jgi:hypothetical protein
MVFDEAGASAFDFVGANRGADAAAADGDAAFNLSCDDSASERRDKIGIVVVGGESVGAEVNNIVAGGAEAGKNLHLEREAAVICGNAEAHE